MTLPVISLESLRDDFACDVLLDVGSLSTDQLRDKVHEVLRELIWGEDEGTQENIIEKRIEFECDVCLGIADSWQRKAKALDRISAVVEELEQICTRHGELSDTDRYRIWELDGCFHSLLCDVAELPQVHRTIIRIVQEFVGRDVGAPKDINEAKNIAEQHRAIFDAITRDLPDDKEIRAAVRSHAEQSGRRWRQLACEDASILAERKMYMKGVIPKPAIAETISAARQRFSGLSEMCQDALESALSRISERYGEIPVEARDQILEDLLLQDQYPGQYVVYSDEWSYHGDARRLSRTVAGAFRTSREAFRYLSSMRSDERAKAFVRHLPRADTAFAF